MVGDGGATGDKGADRVPVDGETGTVVALQPDVDHLNVFATGDVGTPHVVDERGVGRAAGTGLTLATRPGEPTGTAVPEAEVGHARVAHDQLATHRADVGTPVNHVEVGFEFLDIPGCDIHRLLGVTAVDLEGAAPARQRCEPRGAAGQTQRPVLRVDDEACVRPDHDVDLHQERTVDLLAHTAGRDNLVDRVGSRTSRQQQGGEGALVLHDGRRLEHAELRKRRPQSNVFGGDQVGLPLGVRGGDRGQRRQCRRRCHAHDAWNSHEAWNDDQAHTDERAAHAHARPPRWPAAGVGGRTLGTGESRHRGDHETPIIFDSSERTRPTAPRRRSGRRGGSASPACSW